MKEAVFAFGPNSEWDLCVQHYLDFIFYGKSQSKETLRQYRCILTHFFSEPPKRPDEYTKADVLAFIHSPSRTSRSKGQPPTPSAMNYRLNVLRSFYSFAANFTVLKDGKLQPILTTMPPTMGLHDMRVPKVMRTLSEEEIRLLFVAIPDTMRGARDRALIAFLFWSMRRVSEVARLTWGDVAYMTVREQNGATRQAWVYAYVGKGRGGERRIIEFPEDAKKALDQYLEKSGRMAEMQASSPLFPNLINGKALTPDGINYILKGYAAVAGLDARKMSAHVWRHSGAQQRYLAGQDLLSLRDVLGHSSLAITDVYVRGLVSMADPGVSLLREKFAFLSKS